MSAKTKHIHLSYTTYHLCRKDGGISSNKTNTNCKTCLKLYKRYKDMIKELTEYKDGIDASHILCKYNFI